MNHSKNIIFSLLLIFQYACTNSENNAKTTVTEKIKVENKGVHIDYTDSKVGDTTLLFVHGWNIDKTYWENQIAFFANKYRVVAIDLPGFGKSGKNRKSWTVEDYGKDITSVLTQLNLKNVILIGHSMSGAIIVDAALHNPSRIIGIIGIDNFTNFGSVQSPQIKEDVANAYKALRKNYKQVTLQYANQSLFSPSTGSAVRKRVLSDFMNADSVIAVNCLEQNDQYPIDEKLKSLKMILYLINSDFRHTDTTSFKKSNIQYHLFNIGPTGHYPMIEKPDEFNFLLAQAVIKIGE